MPTYFLDLTPFIPVLTDGRPHNISIDVASAEADHAILQNWFLSGVLQVFNDRSSRSTTGKITKYSAEPFSRSNVVGTINPAGDIKVVVSATREVRIESTIISGSGEVNHVVWSQSMQYKNIQTISNNTLMQA